MSTMISFEKGRASSFKPTITANGGRLRRHGRQNMIRKTKKDDRLEKRRFGDSQTTYSKDMIVQVGSNNYTIDDIPKLISVLKSAGSSDQQKLHATRGLRRLMAVANNIEVVNLILGDNVLPHFVKNLEQGNNWELINTTLHAFASITCTEWIGGVAVEPNAVNNVIQLLHHGEADVQLGAALVLANIAVHSVEYRKGLLKLNVLDPLLHIVINDPKTHDLLHHVVCCISNLCTELPSLSEDKMSLLITAMVMVLRHDLPTEIWANSVRVLGCLSDANDYLKKAIVETGITKELVQLLVEKNSTLLYEALKCIGNLVAGLDAQEAVGARILPRIHPIMVSNQRQLSKEACQVVSNIAAGGEEQITSILLNHDVMKAIMYNAKNAPWDVQMEAILTITSVATIGNEFQVAGLVQEGGIEALICAIPLAWSDCTILSAILDAFKCILDVGRKHNKDYSILLEELGGNLAIESLQEHQNDEVYLKSLNILESYFEVPTTEDENVVPETTTDGTFAFGLQSKPLLPPVQKPNILLKSNTNAGA